MRPDTPVHPDTPVTRQGFERLGLDAERELALDAIPAQRK